MNKKHFQILQADTRAPFGKDVLFSSYHSIKEQGIRLSTSQYKKVYEGDFPEDEGDTMPVTERIFQRFNIARPKDFQGHSLSISDIIVLSGKYYFCDSLGFVELGNWHGELIEKNLYEELSAYGKTEYKGNN